MFFMFDVTTMSQDQLREKLQDVDNTIKRLVAEKRPEDNPEMCSLRQQRGALASELSQREQAALPVAG